MTAPDLAPDFATREAYYLSLFRGTELLRKRRSAGGRPGRRVRLARRADGLASGSPTPRARGRDPRRARRGPEGDAHLRGARVLLRLGRATEPARRWSASSRPSARRARGGGSRGRPSLVAPASRGRARGAGRAGHTRLARLLGGVHEGDRPARPRRRAVCAAARAQAAHRRRSEPAPPPRGARSARPRRRPPRRALGRRLRAQRAAAPALTPLRPSGTRAAHPRAASAPPLSSKAAVGERHATSVATPDRALVLRFDAVRTAAPAFTAEPSALRARPRHGAPRRRRDLRVRRRGAPARSSAAGTLLKGYAETSLRPARRRSSRSTTAHLGDARLTPDGDTLPYVHVRGRGQLVRGCRPAFFAVEPGPGRRRSPDATRFSDGAGCRHPPTSPRRRQHRGLVVLTGHGHLFVASS